MCQHWSLDRCFEQLGYGFDSSASILFPKIRHWRVNVQNKIEWVLFSVELCVLPLKFGLKLKWPVTQTCDLWHRHGIKLKFDLKVLQLQLQVEVDPWPVSRDMRGSSATGCWRQALSAGDQHYSSRPKYNFSKISRTASPVQLKIWDTIKQSYRAN